jgi:hypothetical protein
MDLKHAIENRKTNKIHEQIENLRNLIGRIDDMYTRLEIKLNSMEQNGHTDKYPQHVQEFEVIYNKIKDIHLEIDRIVYMDYFHKYPELREKL